MSGISLQEASGAGCIAGFLVSTDDLEGLEMIMEVLGNTNAVARISKSLAAIAGNS